MLRGGTGDALGIGGFSPFELFGIAFSGMALLFVGVGLYIVYVGFRKGRASSRRDEFVPVRARVRSSELGEYRSSGAGRHGTSTTRYQPEIEYEYRVDGETYTNDSVWPGEDLRGTNEEKRRAVVERYPEGETVEAFYDPGDPSVAFLENESQSTASITLIVFGAGFALTGLLAVGFGLVFLL